MTKREALDKLKQADALLGEVRSGFSSDEVLSAFDADNTYFWLLNSLTNTLHVLVQKLTKAVRHD